MDIPTFLVNIIRQKRRAARLAMAFGFLLFTTDVLALRCGPDLVFEGESKLQTLRKCGEPALVEHRVEYRTIRQRGTGIQQPGFDLERTVAVNIDEWTYNFGPHTFMARLTYENGRLVRIEDLEYGF